MNAIDREKELMKRATDAMRDFQLAEHALYVFQVENKTELDMLRLEKKMAELSIFGFKLSDFKD